jgi:hypothetical protein
MSYSKELYFKGCLAHERNCSQSNQCILRTSRNAHNPLQNQRDTTLAERLLEDKFELKCKQSKSQYSFVSQ